MYFLHIASVLESSVLLAMAFDRLVAISPPLRYRAITAELTVVKIGLAMLGRAAISLLPIPVLLKRLTYCRGSSLSHASGFHPDLMKLACADISANILYGLVVILSTAVVDAVFILLSYFLTIRALVKVGARGRRSEALNTCASHFCAFLLLLLPMISLSMLHRFRKNVPPLVNAVAAYLIVPPALNPIILQHQIQADLESSGEDPAWEGGPSLKQSRTHQPLHSVQSGSRCAAAQAVFLPTGQFCNKRAIV